MDNDEKRDRIKMAIIEFPRSIIFQYTHYKEKWTRRRGLYVVFIRPINNWAGISRIIQTHSVEIVITKFAVILKRKRELSLVVMVVTRQAFFQHDLFNEAFSHTLRPSICFVYATKAKKIAQPPGDKQAEIYS